LGIKNLAEVYRDFQIINPTIQIANEGE